MLFIDNQTLFSISVIMYYALIEKALEAITKIKSYSNSIKKSN